MIIVREHPVISEPILDDNASQQGFVRWLSVTVFFATLTAWLTFLALNDRPRFEALMWEDAAAEWATFFAFAIAGLLGLVAVIRAIATNSDEPSGTRRTAYRLIVLALSLFCLLAAAEEISWGQRVIGFMPPEIFQEINFQQELNFHNILQYFISPLLIIVMVCFGYGVILPGTAFYYSARSREGPTPLSQLASPAFCLAPWFALTGVVYWVCDIKMSTEAAEMVLGLLFLADMLFKIELLKKSANSPWQLEVGFMPTAVLMLAVGLGFLANPLLEKFVVVADPVLVKRTRTELDNIGKDLIENKGIHPELPGTNELVDSRILHGLRSGWLKFREKGYFRSATGEDKLTALGKRQTYFLDPWNNAYWIRMQGFGPVYLYSFGPNRRLDTVFGDDEGVPRPEDVRGDDIGVWIDPFRA